MIWGMTCVVRSRLCLVCYASNVAYVWMFYSALSKCNTINKTKDAWSTYLLHKNGFLCVCVFLSVFLTTLCDVVNAAIYDHRYVRLCELLLVQPVSSTPCSCLDSCTPARKIQLSLSFYVQSSKKREEETNKEERRINRWVCEGKPFHH